MLVCLSGLWYADRCSWKPRANIINASLVVAYMLLSLGCVLLAVVDLVVFLDVVLFVVDLWVLVLDAFSSISDCAEPGVAGKCTVLEGNVVVSRVDPI